MDAGQPGDSTEVDEYLEIGPDSSVEFDAVPLSEAKDEADDSEVKFVKGLSAPSRVAETGSGQRVRLESRSCR